MQNDADRNKRQALYQDLVWKSRNLPAEARNRVLADAITAIQFDDPSVTLGERSLYLLNADNDRRELAGRLRHFDVGIVTVLDSELNSVLLALGKSPTTPENLNIGPHRYWVASIRRKRGDRLSVVVTVVGAPRNVPCAIVTDRLLATFDIGLVVLVGIAAGLKGKVREGDVVCSQRVIDYEGARRELEASPTTRQRKGERGRSRGRAQRIRSVLRMRPVSLDVDVTLRSDLGRFDPASKLLGRFRRLAARLRGNVGARGVRPRCHKATLIAGEKLIADGSVTDERLRYDDRIRAADMEDSGFAQACEYDRKPWIVFRGISDFGDPKKGVSDEFQPVAALAAASAAVLFLEGPYRCPPRRPGS